jgi:hypothetical protein
MVELRGHAFKFLVKAAAESALQETHHHGRHAARHPSEKSHSVMALTS